jgi:hypothetical protein
MDNLYVNLQPLGNNRMLIGLKKRNPLNLRELLKYYKIMKIRILWSTKSHRVSAQPTTEF